MQFDIMISTDDDESSRYVTITAASRSDVVTEAAKIYGPSVMVWDVQSHLE